MVGNHHQRLAGEAEALGFHGRDDGGQRLAHANFVMEQDGGVLQDAPDGVLLVGTQGDVPVQTGGAQVCAVVLAHTVGVEAFVVDFAQPRGAFRIAPQPAFELGLDLAEFGLRRDGLVLVHNPERVSIFRKLIVDGDRLGVQPGGDQVQRAGARRSPAASRDAIRDAPLIGGLDLPMGEMRNVVDAILAVCHQMLEEPDNHIGRDPARTQRGADFARLEVERDDAFQRSHILLKGLVECNNRLRGAQFLTDIPGEVLIGHHPTAAIRQAEDAAFEIAGHAGHIASA